MFDLFYKKNDNSQLFSYLEKNGFVDIQNYIPIYSRFFNLDENNYNNINLNNRYSINEIINRDNNNNFDIKVMIVIQIVNMNINLFLLCMSTYLNTEWLNKKLKI